MRPERFKLFGFLLIAGLFQACGTGFVKPVVDPVLPASMFVEAKGAFCDASLEDKFTLGYYGANPLDTTMYFYIICHAKDTVYRADWPSIWMLDDNLQGSDSLKIQILHQKMYDLVGGKMNFVPDTTALLPPSNQPEFNFDLNGHFTRRLYFSKELKKAIEI